MYKILLIEDDLELSEITCIQLTHAGYNVVVAYDGKQAEHMLEQDEYEIILLDMMLPDSNGDILCKSIREKCRCPVIFLSCLGDSTTIINALRSGGDDYMVKPVNIQELQARMDAVMRRYEQKQVSTVQSFRKFSVDSQRRCILRNGEVIDLSSIEYGLLEYMINHPDVLLLYQELYQNVWDSDCLGDFRTVMVHISNLRKKIDPDHCGIIETIRGAGYIFSDI